MACEYDAAVVKEISEHPHLGKLGDGAFINALVKNLPAIIELIKQLGPIIALFGGNQPAPTPAPAASGDAANPSTPTPIEQP